MDSELVLYCPGLRQARVRRETRRSKREAAKAAHTTVTSKDVMGNFAKVMSVPSAHDETTARAVSSVDTQTQ